MVKYIFYYINEGTVVCRLDIKKGSVSGTFDNVSPGLYTRDALTHRGEGAITEDFVLRLQRELIDQSRAD